MAHNKPDAPIAAADLPVTIDLSSVVRELSGKLANRDMELALANAANAALVAEVNRLRAAAKA